MKISSSTKLKRFLSTTSLLKMICNKISLMLRILIVIVEMCLWVIRKVCRGRKIIRVLTTHLHNMLFTTNYSINQMFHLLLLTDYELESQDIRLTIIYLSLIYWFINQMHEKWDVEVIVETSSQYEHSLIFNQIVSK